MFLFQVVKNQVIQKIKSEYGFGDAPVPVENAATLQNSYIANYTNSSGKTYRRFVLKNHEGKIFDYRLHMKVTEKSLENPDSWLSETEWKKMIGIGYVFDFTPISGLKISLGNEKGEKNYEKKEKFDKAKVPKKMIQPIGSEKIISAFEEELRDREMHWKYKKYLEEIVESPEKFADIMGRYRDIYGFIDASAKEFNVDPVLVCAIIYAESVLGKHMVSSAGAYGFMQVKKDTAQFMKDVYRKYFTQEDVENFKDDGQNIRFGTFYFQLMLEKFNQPDLASLGYSSGPGNAVKKLNGLKDFHPDNYIYVQAVYAYYKFFKSFGMRELLEIPMGNSDYYYGKAYSEFLANLEGAKSDTYLRDFDFKQSAEYNGH